MLRRLFAILVVFGSSACQPTPCDQWKDWEFPKLDKIVTCSQGSIVVKPSGPPETLWPMFEKRGYERGWSEGYLIMDDWTPYFVKKGVDEMYSAKLDDDEVRIHTQSQKELAFLPLAEVPLLDSFPTDLAAWHDELAPFPAEFDNTLARAPTCDAAMVSEAVRPLARGPRGAFLLNIDQLESGTETRKGVPKLLIAHERTAARWLRDARRDFDLIRQRKTVLAFRVTKYVEPAFVGGQKRVGDTLVQNYTSGLVALDLALMSFTPAHVICRTRVVAKSSFTVLENSNLEMDLERNVGLSVSALFAKH